jgi:alpha-glucosidase
VLNACRTAINRRYRLMPYIYTIFREASVDGMPVMRPLFMADAKDLSLRSEDRSFLLGNNLMIVPKWAGKCDLLNNWQYLALEDKSDQYQAELRQRPGSVIPLANLAQSTDEMSGDSLTLLVCLDEKGEAVGTLYEDAGDGFAYRTGDYSLSQLEATLNKRQLYVRVTRKEGRREQSSRVLRIGYVKNGKVRYSAWQKGEMATMKI